MAWDYKFIKFEKDDLSTVELKMSALGKQGWQFASYIEGYVLLKKEY
jgi:hypothetical protein